MPELPDVAAFKKYFDATSLHQRITGVDVSDRRALAGISSAQLAKRLTGRRFQSTMRHGKNLFARLDNGSHVRFHFGMTGRLRYYTGGDKPPDHTRVVFRFQGGGRLVYICPRLLGRVTITEDPGEFIQSEGLGPDAESIERKEFIERIGGRRGKLKSTLTNQAVMAGLGNIYADEVLFQAGYHPDTAVSALDEKDLRKIYSAMRRVMKVAINHMAITEKLPRTWLHHAREDGAPCPKCHGHIRQTRIGQRSAYYCPAHQKCKP